MSEPVKRGPGRPAKSKATKYRGWQVRFLPEELEEFKRQVPSGERAQFVREAIREKLAAARPARGEEGESGRG